MTIESAVRFRRGARIACLVLIAGLLPGSAAMAQLPIPPISSTSPPPPVLSGSVIPFNHGSSGLWNQIYAMAEAPNGTIVFLDSAGSKIYQLAPGASEPTLVVGAGTSTEGDNNCSSLDSAGGYWNAGIAVDSGNNLYVGNRYSGVTQFCRVPYVNGAWSFSSADNWPTTPTPMTYAGSGSNSPINPQYMTITPGTTPGTLAYLLNLGSGYNTLYFSTSGNVGGNAIYMCTVNVANGDVGNITPIITGLEAIAGSIAVDGAGNLYFSEGAGTAPASRVDGVLEITASQIASVVSNLAADPTGITGSGGTAEKSATLIGTSNDYYGIGGISLDAQGNLYIASADASDVFGSVDGVFMVPNEGTPTNPNLVWNDTVMVSPVGAAHQAFVDPRGFLWIQTGGSGNWTSIGTAAPACDQTNTQTVDATCLSSGVVVWKPGMGNLGSAASASGVSPVTISSFSVVATGGTLTLTANNSFTEGQVVTFTDTSASDPLYPLNGLSFYVATPVSGTQFTVNIPTTSTNPGYIAGGTSGSTAATVKLTPYTTVYYTFNQPETPAKGSFVPTLPNGTVNTNFTVLASDPTPGQNDSEDTVNGIGSESVPPCTVGTTYPAFSPNEEAIGNPISGFSWCAVFLQLNTQSPGLVGSDMQMLNASGVITGSNVDLGGVGQGAAISSLATPTMSTVVAGGLSTPGQVAVDTQGDVYVADAGLKKIAYYAAGTSSASAPTATYGTSLTAPTGVAVDGAGDIFIGDSGDIYEIPDVNGVLGTQTRIASGLGGQLSLAVDAAGDLFVADKTNKQVDEIVNPQSQLLRESLPTMQVLGAGDFTAPLAIAADNSGNVWVGDGDTLWEIAMPFGAATKVTQGLQGPVTGLAIDPSGSVFVADAAGLQWIPYQSTGLSVNGIVTMASGFGSSTLAPVGVGLDGSENAYVDYGSSAAAGLSQVSINGAIDFNNTYSEISPGLSDEVDAPLYNVGNTPLTLSAFTPSPGVDTLPNSDYSLETATVDSPACSSSTGVSPGSWCYLGLDLTATATGTDDTTATILSNALNAPSGLSLALSATVVADNRPATSITVTFASNTSLASVCGANSTYPGCETATVTVTSANGTPGGVDNVTIEVPGSGTSQDEQTGTLNSSGKATFNFTNLSGGTYPVLVTYAGEGTLTPACSGSGCFAASAYKTTLTISPATPVFAVGQPGNAGCLNYTASGCAPDTSNVTPYLGNVFVGTGTAVFITASVTSTVGTPTGSVSFLMNKKPVDPAQPQNSLSGSGIAEFETDNLPAGTYTLTAQYNGDQNYAVEDITLGTFYVIKTASYDEVTASPSTLTTPAGTPVSTTLTLMPLVGYSNSVGVSLECVSATLPNYADCTFGYSSSSVGLVPIASGTAATITVTINTDVPTTSGAIAPPVTQQSPWALAGLFGLGLLGVIVGRKRLNRYLAMICLAMMLSGVCMSITSCNNSGYSTPPPKPSSPTTPGTYNVQIITYNPTTLQDSSIGLPTSTPGPTFTLPVTITSSSTTQ